MKTEAEKEALAEIVFHGIKDVHSPKAGKDFTIDPRHNLRDLPWDKVPRAIGTFRFHPHSYGCRSLSPCVAGSAVCRYTHVAGPEFKKCYYTSFITIVPYEGSEWQTRWEDGGKYWALGVEKNGVPVNEWEYHLNKQKIEVVYDGEGKGQILRVNDPKYYGVLPKKQLAILNDQLEYAQVFKSQPVQPDGSMVVSTGVVVIAKRVGNKIVLQVAKNRRKGHGKCDD